MVILENVLSILIHANHLFDHPNLFSLFVCLSIICAHHTDVCNENPLQFPEIPGSFRHPEWPLPQSCSPAPSHLSSVNPIRHGSCHGINKDRDQKINKGRVSRDDSQLQSDWPAHWSDDV